MVKAINKPIFILGVYYGHNSTALLMRDGQVIACASEERFTGVKNYTGLPFRAISYVLTEAGISATDLEGVTVSHRYRAPIYAVGSAGQSLLMKLLVTIYRLVKVVKSAWSALSRKIPAAAWISRFFYYVSTVTVAAYVSRQERKALAEHLNLPPSKVVAYDHHLSHAASAYYASPLNKRKTLVFTADGEGDFLSATVSVFDKNKFTRISQTAREHSLGYLYAYLTSYLGMKPNEHEYKVMGLAAYVKPEDSDPVYEKIRHAAWVNKQDLTIHTAFNTMDAWYWLRQKFSGIRFDFVACAVQRLVEDVVCEWVEAAIARTGIQEVILAGGLFMNVKINQRISKIAAIRSLFILPSCGDESSIIGSSYLRYLELAKQQSKPYSVVSIGSIYWGPQFNKQDILNELGLINAFKKYTVQKPQNMEKKIAELLAEGVVVARVAGRMEFGARALGNRSILADPRKLDVIQEINDRIKNRDFWMPFAPSILDSRQKDYLVNPKKFAAYYMMLAFDTTRKAKKELKATMHQSDCTVRPQIVTRKMNPTYYNLIEHFQSLTGVGAVLNTSFNLHGYPIVLGPKEALYVFANSGLTHLALEDYLLIKKRS